MASFDLAVKYVLENEGGLSDNPSDPGGITNFGISLRFLKSIPDARLRKYGIFDYPNEDTIRTLTVDQAKSIYKGEFWSCANFDDIVSQDIANYIFDMCVNHGIATGIKITQRALWACTKKREPVDDGILGPNTLNFIRQGAFLLATAMRAERSAYIRYALADHPAAKDNINGWLNRCYR